MQLARVCRASGTSRRGPVSRPRLRIREHIKGIAIGIVAASAENPKLLDPVRRAIAEDWKELKESSDDPDAAASAWLAIEGLGSLEMHDLSPLTNPTARW